MRGYDYFSCVHYLRVRKSVLAKKLILLYGSFTPPDPADLYISARTFYIHLRKFTLRGSVTVLTWEIVDSYCFRVIYPSMIFNFSFSIDIIFVSSFV